MRHSPNFKRGICLSLIVLTIVSIQSRAQTITNLTGFYRSGQVFLTWDRISNNAAFYKVYRSTSPINSSGDLATSEYLGYTNSASVIDHNLSNHDGTAQYLHIDSGAAPLSSTEGLFVATTLVNGNYYYAVTTLIGPTENTSIVPGTNSLSSSISETVAMPIPVFQSQRTIAGVPVDIYTIFTSSKYAVGQPLYLQAGFLANDFLLNRNNATINKPIKFFFHGGGGDFFTGINVTDGDELRINLEDYYPDSTILSNWWGANPGFDVYKMSNNTVIPTTGINNNFIQQRITYIIDWAIHRLPIDSNRIYFSAISAGSAGAYFYAITYPERIAAVSLQVGLFNIPFQNDWQSACPLNTGNSNRIDINLRLGTVQTNLMSNLGVPTYDALNGGLVIHQFPTRDYPLIYSLNGKQDIETGWTEKTIYYDSVNTNHLGGYYFWDNRGHSGSAGQTWSGSNFDLYRYHRNSSYPAFAFCNLNEDDGDGNGNTGADHGTLNGPLDWNDNITDNSQTWEVKAFIRDLHALQNVTITYPDSATADVTPRRLQTFSPNAGDEIAWEVKHNGQTIQSGSFVYDGVLMIVPQVKIFRDTSTITLTIVPTETFYRDHDGDGFGNPDSTIQATSQPNGYVSDNSDCNDLNAGIHPGATEVCNTLDDNCNGQVDEGVTTTFYRDADGDGFGNLNVTTQACSAPSGYVSNSTDCNDGNGSIHPGATEVCNTLDDNCNGQIDEGVTTTFYRDADSDGFGNLNITTQACSAPSGYVSNSTDCNDGNGSIHPGATEVCNTLDDNCNSQVDEGVTTTFYRDADSDGFGNVNITTQACSAPSGYVSNSTDCNDGNASIHPGATEVINGLDDNCNGQIDEGTCSISVNAGNDVITTYGYGTQCVTRTAIVSGGTAPFTYSWSLNRPLVCNNIRPSGDETFTGGTCSNNICPVTGSLANTPACSSATLTACLITPGTACVTVTDASGCTASDCFVINARDVRCFAGNTNVQKVKVCHSGSTICVNANAVAAHLAHGDCLGACGPNCTLRMADSGDELSSELRIYPNPSSGEFNINLVLPIVSESSDENNSQEATVRVINTIGQTVYDRTVSVVNGELMENIQLSSAIPNGMYLIQVIVEGEVYSGQVIYQK